MTNELFFMINVLIMIFIIGFLLSCKVKRKVKGRNSIISWYNSLLDQYVSFYQKAADQYEEKLELAEKYIDSGNLNRLHKLYGDTVRTAENIEKKLNDIKEGITDKDFANVTDLFVELKVVESYIAELADIAALIRSIHPASTSSDFEYEYERFTYHTEQKSARPSKSSSFFASCKSKEELTQKYRELAKFYHPDNAFTGNEDSFKKLKNEYDEYLK